MGGPGGADRPRRCPRSAISDFYVVRLPIRTRHTATPTESIIHAGHQLNSLLCPFRNYAVSRELLLTTKVIYQPAISIPFPRALIKLRRRITSGLVQYNGFNMFGEL